MQQLLEAKLVACAGSIAGGVVHLLHSEIITDTSSASLFVFTGFFVLVPSCSC